MDIRKKIGKILYDMGFCIDSENDVNLLEYGMDSLQFIDFIISVEEEFGIIIPDEALLMENISSLNGFITYVESIIEENNRLEIFISC